jgi:hypothetical protein
MGIQQFIKQAVALGAQIEIGVQGHPVPPLNVVSTM